MSADSVSAAQQKFIPFSAPWIGDEEKQEILQVLDSDWITTGPRTKAFEAAMQDVLGCRHAVALNSCTGALHISLAALGIGPGDGVLTTPLTFASTANVIVHVGARPILIDIEPETYNIDPAAVKTFLETKCRMEGGELKEIASGARIRAITAVHYAGQPCDMDALSELAARYKLALVEDAAHALGATYRGRPVGNLGVSATTCFSFYPTKNITTGEGGVLATNDDAIAARARVLSLHGISRDAWKRYGKEGSWQYDVEEAGFKYNMTDLAAALGLHQIRKLAAFTQRRRQLAAMYDELLSDLPVRRPKTLPHTETAWHLYPIQVMTDALKRDTLIEELRKHNIGSSVHFIPLNLMTFYQQRFGYRKGDLPVAEAVYERLLSLPFFPRMSDKDVARVSEALHIIAGVGRTPAKGNLDTAHVVTSGLSLRDFSESLAPATDLLSHWRHQPYPGIKDIALDRRVAYSMDSISAGESSGARTLVAFSPTGRAEGLIQIESLPWDTRMLGTSAGRISWFVHRNDEGGEASKLLEAGTSEARRLGIRYLVARTSSADMVSIHLLESNNFHLVDGLVTFGQVPRESSLPAVSKGVEIGLARAEEVESLAEYAAESFRVDRFHMDPAIENHTADELHREWVRNSCAGFADAVIVARIDGRPAGFNTVKCDKRAERILGIRIGAEVLGATSKEYRGRGVWQAISQASINWFAQQGCQWSEVGTQLANIPAARLHEAAGFRIVSSNLTFRRLL